MRLKVIYRHEDEDQRVSVVVDDDTGFVYTRVHFKRGNHGVVWRRPSGWSDVEPSMIQNLGAGYLHAQDLTQ